MSTLKTVFIAAALTAPVAMACSAIVHLFKMRFCMVRAKILEEAATAATAGIVNTLFRQASGTSPGLSGSNLTGQT